MNEIVPGIFHWTARHPDIHARVSSYYVQPAGIVVDPLEPEDGMGFFDELDLAPQQVVLTSGLHWRHADRFRDRYGATIRVISAGVHRWEGTDRSAETFEFGDDVAPGVRALEIGQICPDDTALHISHGPGAVAFADGLISAGGQVDFVPDSLMEDPEDTKRGLRERFRGLLERDFDALLFAHGEPLSKGGYAALKDFVNAPDV
jgi:hypothetical protein